MPNTCFNCLKAIKIPAPAAKPITTELETKFTNFPILTSPINSFITPAINDNKIAKEIKASKSVSGLANLLITAKTTMEPVVVGPEIK